MKIKVLIVAISVLLGIGLTSCSDRNEVSDTVGHESHPCLFLTSESAKEIKDNLENLPMLSSSFEEIENAADVALEEGIIVPIPEDPGGGYTHEQHKRNYMAMYNAGISYQITKDTVYASFVKKMLLEYAKMYPTLGIHPMKKNQTPGKLFWQGLNESVWLVYTIQAYDCIYNTLNADDRIFIEENLFRKVVSFFTVENSYSFNRVHNHGTWAAAGVGMTGMVLKDTNYIKMALYGTDKSGNAGFIKQIDMLFSPDGYYTEGPYYQRYAIMPFILFAKALDNNYKEVDIFNYKEKVLNKAVETLLQLTNVRGRFFPLNDAIKEKNYLSPELIFATNIAYAITHNNELLSIAGQHGKVMISSDGLETAQAIEANKTEDFVRKSVVISDGPKGEQGGIVILRDSCKGNKLEVLVKATSQGMGHGHFDRLSFLMYENGNEIIQDYGAARFLNIEQKHGGRYLPENKTWAKQTIAHNTVVINGKSNFDTNLKEASKYSPRILYADLNQEDINLVTVVDSNCYNNTILRRSMLLLKVDSEPIIIDLFNVQAQTPSTLDLPVYFQGQVMHANFDYQVSEQNIHLMKGQKGYQHLWNLAHTSNLKGKTSVTWMNNNRFYTYSVLADKNTELFFTRIGANDPEFNLRCEPGLLVRQKDATNYNFLSVIEAHGKVDPVKETVSETKSSLKDMKILYQDEDITLINLEFYSGIDINLFISSQTDSKERHKVTFRKVDYEWYGNYQIIINKDI